MPNRVLELIVNNHPGVLSHVTGLFARRAFNLEGIVCAPIGDGRLSRMLLLTADEARSTQIVAQLSKLHDVREVRLSGRIAPSEFMRLVQSAMAPCTESKPE